uniref:Uncharacterized protein n=1 Tax=Arundo donax TaxID=35708 RepID=A0A0A9BKF7_ARUDO
MKFEPLKGRFLYNNVTSLSKME